MTPSWFRILFIVASVSGMCIAVFGHPMLARKRIAQEPCVGHCPPPGPMDCTIYGRKKDGSWPSGFECSSTP